jgi:hypothetical protein
LKLSGGARITGGNTVGLTYSGANFGTVTVTGALTGTTPVAAIDLLYAAADTPAVWNTKPIVVLDGGYSGSGLPTESAKFVAGNFVDSASFAATPIGPAYEIKGDGTLGTP